MRKLGNNRIYPVITVIIAFMSLVAGIPYCRHSVAERHNVRAVHDVVQCPEGASAHLLKAIKLNPGNPVAHLNLGLAYLSQYSDMALEGFMAQKLMELPDSAVIEFEKAVACSVNEPIPVLNLAFAYIVTGKDDKVVSLLVHLVKQTYCWTPVMICYGMLLERQGCEDEARTVYCKAVKQNPIILTSRFFAELKERNPDLACAVQDLSRQKAREEYESFRNPLNTAVLGEMDLLCGDAESAEILLKEALAHLPSMNRPWLYLGMIEEIKGNIDSALVCYEKAAQLDKSDALPIYFKARVEGKTYVMAEQMKSLLSVEQRADLKLRYNSLPMSSSLWVNGFEEYCTYDFMTEIEQERRNRNTEIMETLFSSIEIQKGFKVPYLTSVIAGKMLGTPCENGLLDIYPEKLRIILEKTDKLRFIETCLAMALTYKGASIDKNRDQSYSPYDLLSENIRVLRYRDGVVSKFSDRMFYFSEWAYQAKELGLLEEYTESFGHEYKQAFSYLSDHLMYISSAGWEPKVKETILAIEKRLEESNPYHIISIEEMNDAFFDYLQDGDIVAIISGRKGEDVNNIGILLKQESSTLLIYPSNKERKVVSQDLRQVCQSCLGIRVFRLK